MTRRLIQSFWRGTSRACQTLTVRGDWTLNNYVTLGEQIARLQAERGYLTAAQGNIDLTGFAALEPRAPHVCMNCSELNSSEKSPPRAPG